MKLGIFLPGRLKSERLPEKLILPLDGITLFELACQTLSEVDGVGRYTLLFDKQLIEIAKKYPKIKIIKRDPKTCESDGPLSYIFGALKNLPHTYLMFLNPCMYNLKADTIQKAIDVFLNSGFDYATSAKKYRNWLWHDNKPLLPIDYKTLSTKEISPCYEAAHCFHIFNKTLFFKTGKMLGKDLKLIEVPQEEALDIDTKEDYEYAKHFLMQKRKKQKKDRKRKEEPLG
ncbi:hypothetical protein ACFL3D_01525 [Candidatus Omnitrophota bacterium]